MVGDAPAPMTTGADGVEAGPRPLGLRAVTVKVYEPPPVRPLTVVEVAGALTVT